MRTFYAISALLILGSIGLFELHDSRKDLQRLEAENRELRLRDAARARVKTFKDGKVTVNMEAVANASYDMGAPASVVEAMRRQENGSPLWELGHKGKTALIASCVEPDSWQYYEGARSANKALWRWVMADKKRRKEAIKALGKAYTAEAHASRWARNVDKLEEGIRHAGND